MKKKFSLLFFLLVLLSSQLLSQESINLDDCITKEYEINDHQDADGDGNVCEAMIVLTNSASYTGGKSAVDNLGVRKLACLF